MAVHKQFNPAIFVKQILIHMLISNTNTRPAANTDREDKYKIFTMHMKSRAENPFLFLLPFDLLGF